MSAIGPGDFVECLVGNTATVAGAVYKVSRVVERCGAACLYDDCTEPYLLLSEAKPEWGCSGHCIHRFRPIYRPKSSFIEGLKQPAPREPVSVD